MPALTGEVASGMHYVLLGPDLFLNKSCGGCASAEKSFDCIATELYGHHDLSIVKRY